jgi:hypothetical protein
VTPAVLRGRRSVLSTGLSWPPLAGARGCVHVQGYVKPSTGTYVQPYYRIPSYPVPSYRYGYHRSLLNMQCSQRP